MRKLRISNPYIWKGPFPPLIFCFIYVQSVSLNAMGLAGNVLSLLTVTNLFLGLVAYVALKFGWQIVYYRFFHPLAKFPGPFWASVTRLWIAKHNLQETEVPTVYALAKEYGRSLDMSCIRAPPC